MKGGNIEFPDTARLFGGNSSLADLGKSFKLHPEYSKTEFPHKFASHEHLNYIGSPPDAEYWPSGKIPDELICQVFDFRDKSINYQKLDTVSLCIVYDKLSKVIYDVTALRASDFITGPSLAYQYLIESTPSRMIKKCNDRTVDAFIREYIQGGKCFPKKRYFKSYFEEVMLETSKNEDQKVLRKYMRDVMITWNIMILYLSIQVL